MIENLSFILLTLIMAWFACAKAVTTKEAVSVSAPTREGINVASISKFEKVPAAKERLIKDKVFILEEKMAQDYSEGQKKRDAHPKNPACLQAEFIVEPNIPAELKMGIFASPGTYPAWIRISSSSGTIQPDKIMGG